MNEDKLKELLAYVRDDGKICPNPEEWNILWEILPDKKRVDAGWDPPLPLILAAWYEPHIYKILLFEEHIRYAADHGVLDQVDEYLRGLKPEQWFVV